MKAYLLIVEVYSHGRWKPNTGSGKTVTRLIDNLSGEWLSDDNYITTPQKAKNSSFSSEIIRTANDESDGLNSNKYIAPIIVYQTAKETKTDSIGLNWSIHVEKNTNHFLRLHFYDVLNQQSLVNLFPN